MTRSAGLEAGGASGGAGGASGGATTFTFRRVQALLGLSRTIISGLIAEGFISPGRGPGNVWCFSLQDVMLLRTAHALRAAKIPSRRIVRTLARLKATLPAELPLSGLRITAVGNEIAVRSPQGGPWQADSGQLLLDFDVVAPAAGNVSFLDRGGSGAAEAAFERGVKLETRDVAAAVAAYRQALSLAPGMEAAYLNLGAMLAEAGRFAELLVLSNTAVEHCPDSALLHFNRAVALDHLERLAEAATGYEHALVLDPKLADAHYNLGQLRERLGDPRGALRHLSAYRRLQR